MRQRNAGVHREVQLAIVLVTGRAERADAADRRPGQPVFRNQRTGLRLVEGDAVAEKRQRADPAEREPVDAHARGRASRQRKPGEPRAREIEDLQPLASIRRIGDDESRVGGEIERRRLDDPAALAANLDHLAARLRFGIDAVDRMAAAVEDVIDAALRLLKSDRLAKSVADFGR